jgi:hypothetical protein
MLALPVHKRHIESYLARKQLKQPNEKPRNVQPYANETEQEEMVKCHSASIKYLRSFLDGLAHLGRGRALEVAAGNGIVSRDLLQHKFECIDCFDQCPTALRKLEALRRSVPAMDLVDQATMQSYVWQRHYTGIFLRWCTGYLDDEELVPFLKKAATFLDSNRARSTRSNGPSAFIFVLDNVLEDGEAPLKVEGQWVRKQSDLEQLFRQANLLAHQQTEEIQLHPDFKKTIIWALN